MRLLVPFLLICVSLGSPVTADKVVVDPNTSGAAVRQTAQESDPRLAQRVTYQGGYKRLHSVAEDLTKLTGVTIRAGESGKDWRARDIPLIVCVSDLPLGKLLRAMADAAHLRLAAVLPDSAKAKEPTYRLYRDRKSAKALDSRPDAMAEANLKLANWAWDALTAYAKMPDAPLGIKSVKMNGVGFDARQIKTVASILASLSPEIRAKALAGEQVDLKRKDLHNPELLTSLFDYACTVAVMNRQPVLPTDSERKQATLHLKLQRNETASPSAGLQLLLSGIPEVRVIGGEESRDEGAWNLEPVTVARALAASKSVKITPPPDVDQILIPKDTFPTLGFVRLETDEDWKLPLLQEKVQVKPDTAARNPKLKEVLVPLAASAGVSIVCEDFVSHKTISSSVNLDRGPDATLGSVLRQLGPYKREEEIWFASESDRLLVGWHSDWRRKHLSLIPESVLVNIQEKSKGAGAELDDMVPLVALTKDQYSEWAVRTGTCNSPLGIGSDTRGLWELYAALSPDEWKMAKSENGLPLAKFDTAWLSSFIAAAKKRSDNGGIYMAFGEFPPELVRKIDLEKRVFADPVALSRLTLHVISQPEESWEYFGPDRRFHTYRPGPNGIQKHSYSLALRGEIDGEKVEITSKWHDMRFPYFTRQKEDAMLKKAMEAEKGKG